MGALELQCPALWPHPHPHVCVLGQLGLMPGPLAFSRQAGGGWVEKGSRALGRRLWPQVWTVHVLGLEHTLGDFAAVNGDLPKKIIWFGSFALKWSWG